MRLLLSAGVLGGWLLAPAAAGAHDLRSSADIDPATVTISGWYDDDDTPAGKAKVTVTDAAGATVAAGVLDDRGVWSFPRPAPGHYTVVVESAGHRDRLEFEIAADVPTGAFSNWRLDKRLGVAIGLGVLLGGTLVFRYFRRGRRRPD